MKTGSVVRTTLIVMATVLLAPIILFFVASFLAGFFRA